MNRPSPAPVSHPPDTRLIVLEGVYGSGKSITARYLVGQLRAAGLAVTTYGDATLWGQSPPPDILRQVLADLPDQRLVWRRLGPEELTQRSLRAWAAFVADSEDRSEVHLFDGRFFHVDFAGLMMMEMSEDRLLEHASRILEIARPLQPRIIYLHPREIGEGLREMARRRGRGWVDTMEHRMEWKVQSPYWQRRGLGGLDGWIEFYGDYMKLCRWMLDQLGVPNLQVETSDGDWARCRAEILSFLGVRPRRDVGYQAWWLTKRPRLWLARTIGNLRQVRDPRG